MPLPQFYTQLTRLPIPSIFLEQKILLTTQKLARGLPDTATANAD